jgi:hypothetical protein
MSETTANQNPAIERAHAIATRLLELDGLLEQEGVDISVHARPTHTVMPLIDVKGTSRFRTNPFNHGKAKFSISGEVKLNGLLVLHDFDRPHVPPKVFGVVDEHGGNSGYQYAFPLGRQIIERVATQKETGPIYDA